MISNKTPTPSPAASPPRVLVIYAYPTSTSGHGAQMLATTKKVLDEANAPYSVVDLYATGFQPIMSPDEATNYGKNVPADVAEAQAQLSAAQVWIFLYPVWWSTPPAILKGYIDRVFTPGFAFQYSSGGSTPLLTGKRALVGRTFGSSALSEQKIGNVAYGFMEKAVLEFCGVKAVSVDLYSIDSLPATAFNHALFQLSGAVRRQLVTPTAVPHSLRTVSAPYLPPLEARSSMPVLSTDDEEKPELSDEAKSDLEFFKSARKAARAKIIGSPLPGGRGGDRGRGDRGRGDRGRGDNRGGSFTGRTRSDDRIRGGGISTGRSSERSNRRPFGVGGAPQRGLSGGLGAPSAEGRSLSAQGADDRERGPRRPFGSDRPRDSRGPREARPPFGSENRRPAAAPGTSSFSSGGHRDARPQQMGNRPMRGGMSYSGRGSEGGAGGAPGSRPPSSGRPDMRHSNGPRPPFSGDTRRRRGPGRR